MARRKTQARTLPQDWTEATEITINGRHVQPGTELSIRGERGRFRFVKHVSRPERGIEWIDVWGGPKGSPQLRSFRPEQVRRVHRLKIDPKALLAARKEALADETE